MSLTRPAIILLLLLAIGAALLMRGAPGEDVSVQRSRIIMGTVVEITVLGSDREMLEQAVTAAFEEMSRLETLLSTRIAESDVSRLSWASRSAQVSRETIEVVSIGLRAAGISGGAFDLTLGQLKELWGIESERPRIPSAEEISQSLAGTGPHALRIETDRVVKAEPNLKVDLGGVAKGYAVDRAAAVLQRAGVEDGTVNAGGDLRLLGSKGGQPWRIGIQHPRNRDSLLVVLPLENRAVVTSGDYERFFEQGGRRYHHLFDPRTGYPARLCQGATVVAETAAWADAMATVAFVLGPEAGIELLERLERVEGMLIDADGRAHLTSGLKGVAEWR